MTRPPTDLTGFPDPATDPVAAALRRALHQEAAVVQPSQGSLAQIRERVEAERGPARWLPVLAAAAAVVVVAGAAVAVVGDRGTGAAPAGPAATASPEPTGAGEPSPSATDPPEPAPSATGATTEPPPSGTPSPTAPAVAVPVYWVGATRTTFVLYREFQRASGDPVEAALRTMLAGEPADPDYSNPWSPAPVSVEVRDDELVVDLGSAAFAQGVGSELAAVAVQQLVWTATAAAQADVPVRVLVDGQPGYEAWGALVLDEPVERDPDVQAPTWVLDPVEGGVVEAGAVTVSGQGVAFEGTLLWEVTDLATDEVVREGFTTAGGGERLPFSFDVPDLQPGEYEVVVYAPDESGGESPEGPRLFPDSKRFVVR